MTDPQLYADDTVAIYAADCMDMLADLDDDMVDAVVCDPPYGLDFMGKAWDRYTPGQFQNWCEKWAAECLRVLKPGGHLVAFGGTRTWHRLAAGIEDAGFEMRDSMAWLYGSGFPKSMDVSKAIDKAAGVTRAVVGTKTGRNATPCNDMRGGRSVGGVSSGIDTSQITAPATDAAKQWEGWGTALKPAFEPIVVARKPFKGTVAANVLTHGTGALHIDACRVGTSGGGNACRGGEHCHCAEKNEIFGATKHPARREGDFGRWPANVLLDGDMADALDEQSGKFKGRVGMTQHGSGTNKVYGTYQRSDQSTGNAGVEDYGGASRFFPVFRYQAKAPTKERPKIDGTAHPTVKPLALIEWLITLVTPQDPDAIVLDPFAGSGTTVEACIKLGVRCIASEREPTYLPLIIERINRAVPNNQEPG